MRQAFFVLIFSGIASAQVSDGISASVNRSVTLTADEAAFQIVVGATLDGTQQQVKQALQAAGLPNPTVVATRLSQDTSSVPVAQVQIVYLGTVTIAAASARDAAKSLETLRAQLPAPLRSLQYSVAFQASQAAIDSMRLTLLPQLVAEAQSKAQSLTAAAGVKLGAIMSISDSQGGAVGGVLSGAPAAYARVGDFSGSGFILAGYPAATNQYTFYLNVLFHTAQ